jgi:hypothetical protein
MQKLTKDQFKASTKCEIIVANKKTQGVKLTTKTSCCTYGQFYKDERCKNCIERYLDFYYPMYEKDHEEDQFSEDN